LNNKSGITLVKIGGATLGSHDTTIEDLITLQQQGVPQVVVHGGGKLITQWLDKLGIASRFVRGERVTDVAALEVVTAVLGGLVNKEITAAINGGGGRALGLSGIDGTILRARLKNKELEYVGEVTGVTVAPITALLEAGYIPVIAPLGLVLPGKPADKPQTVNINADIAAGEIAAAINAERLVFLTDVDGIRDQSGQRLARLTPPEAEALIDSGVASGGMIPKVTACLRAALQAASSSIIDGRQPHALLNHLRGADGGTIIRQQV
jgi:acetylglutamate kinase